MPATGANGVYKQDFEILYVGDNLDLRSIVQRHESVAMKQNKDVTTKFTFQIVSCKFNIYDFF